MASTTQEEATTVPTTSLTGGRLRVTHAPTVGVTAVPVSRQRDGDGPPGVVDVTPELLEALQESEVRVDRAVGPDATAGFDVVEHLALTPTGARGADAAEAPVELVLDLGAGEDAVVLFEQGGCYSWHLPSGERRLGDGSRRSARFSLDAAPGTATVLSFWLPDVGALAVKTLESRVRTGLIRLTTPAPSGWLPVAGIADLALPQGKPSRVLLLVHGTFDSTAGAFAAFGAGDPDGVVGGAGFLAAALKDYDAVIGFDHRTLSVNPLENAVELADLLTADPSVTTTYDIVCHSRGGLTVRSLIEEVLPGRTWRGRVDRVVFVGATNAGTHFADADRWGALADLYTNLVAARGRRLSGMPGGRLLVGLATEAVRGVGILVRWLAAYATDPRQVPGIAAMDPDGAFVAELNGDQPGSPRPGTPWFVVSSDFEVTSQDRPAEIPALLAAQLADGVVDQVFDGQPNDLVVDVASMSAIDLSHGGGYVRDELALGTNPRVYHTVYFDDPTVMWALGGWLIDRVDHVGGHGAGPEVADDAVSGGETAEIATDPEAAPPPPALPPPAPEESHQRGPQPATEPAGEQAVLSTFLAELPRQPAVGVPVILRVRMSRKDLEPAFDAAAGRTVLAVLPSMPVDVQVIPTTNAVLAGSDLDQLLLPPGGGWAELQFTLTAPAAGPVAVKVLARQGKTLLGSVVVEAQAVDPADVSGGQQALVRAQVEVAAAGSTELADTPWLEIAQLDRAGETRFQYELRLPGSTVRIVEVSPPLRDVEGFVADLFREVERLWFDSSDQPKTYLAGLQDLGASLFEQLFPQRLQAVLWEHRDELDNLLLLADEPFVPWELVHLKPPTGPRQKAARFLGQLGLIRWRFAPFPAQPALRARVGRIFSVCPDYDDDTLDLDQLALEAQFLTTTLGATAVPATEQKVRALLRRREGLDVLHFSGHGTADPEHIGDAKIVLAGRTVGGALVADYLSSTSVAENARLGRDGAGPLVVLNACQVGQSGAQLSSLGGFARAFLDAGASAFVSCLWSVNQVPARLFVETLYGRLLAGDTVALAAAAAREAARAEGDGTWLAYVVYARPDAVLVHST